MTAETIALRLRGIEPLIAKLAEAFPGQNLLPIMRPDGQITIEISEPTVGKCEIKESHLRLVKGHGTK